MFTMTYNEAIAVQNRQFEHYKQGLTQAAAFKLGNKLIKETGECKGNPDELEKCSTFVSLVPRGTWFEEPENVIIMIVGRRNRSLAPAYHPFKTGVSK